MKPSKAAGTLVVPKWLSSQSWPLICPDGLHLNEHVLDWKLVNITFHPYSLGNNSPFLHRTNIPYIGIEIKLYKESRIIQFNEHWPYNGSPDYKAYINVYLTNERIYIIRYSVQMH